MYIIGIPGGFLSFIIVNFDKTPVESFRQLSVSGRVSSESQQSVVNYFPKYRAKFLVYDTLVNISLDQLFVVSWEL